VSRTVPTSLQTDHSSGAMHLAPIIINC